MIEEPQQKTFDIGSGKIQVENENWYITYSLSTTRYVEYIKRVPKLTFNVTFEGMYAALSSIYMACSSGNDMIYAIQHSRETAMNQLQAIKRFDDNEIPDVLDLVALFINRPGEDLSKFDIALHEEKKSKLMAEGYDIGFFFQLMVNVVQGFSAAFRKIQALEDQSAMTDIRISNTPETSSIS